jgi:hypothetical protein
MCLKTHVSFISHLVDTQQYPAINTTEAAIKVAHYLQTRLRSGKVLVIADRPPVFLSILRKQWLKSAREIQRKRASTLDRALIEQLSQQLTTMKSLRFTARSVDEHHKADVRILAPHTAVAHSTACETVYICNPLDEKTYSLLEQKLPEGCTFVTVLCPNNEISSIPYHD